MQGPAEQQMAPLTSPTDCSTLLISSEHAIWSRISSEFGGTACNRNWHRAAPDGRFRAILNLIIKLAIKEGFHCLDLESVFSSLNNLRLCLGMDLKVYYIPHTLMIGISGGGKY
ncbi:hypothetical protein CEXT_663481 [Caerostris extrusa]|uniref:Uncharacterized protein n=1 Tax=Caerostris extrusa TaxID=172846 RepID=A0AAV4YA78_CAEEX|nr:hypothetical protein CEXT_663481 [Caerostris extrusa]